MNISVIIPFHKCDYRLKRLITSIPIIPNIEVIVIDDGINSSRNDKVFERENLVFTSTSGAQGAGVARNIGMELASGDWLLFADSDDMFLDQWFESVRKYEHTDLDVVYFMPIAKYEDGSDSNRALTYQRLLSSSLDNGDKALKYQFSPPWSKLYRRRFIVKNSITFQPVVASNDLLFSLKVGHLLGGFAVDFSPIYCVFDTTGSLTKITKINILICRLRVATDYNDYIETNNLPTPKINIYKFSVRLFYRFLGITI